MTTSMNCEFVASSWTLSGPSHPALAGGRNFVPFSERIAAAADAGFMGVGLTDVDLAAYREGNNSFSSLRKHLVAAGLGFVQLELITDWFTQGDEKRKSDVNRDFLFEASAELGADHIKIVGDMDRQRSPDDLIESFAAVCEQARKAGARLAIELTPITNLATPEQGLRLIEAAGVSNAGLLLDVWHMGRAGVDFASLAEIAGSSIYSIELDDADKDVRGSLLEDTMNNRRLPGEGALEPAKLIAAVHKAGYRSPYAIEVLSDDHRTLPVREQARVAIATARQQARIAEALI